MFCLIVQATLIRNYPHYFYNYNLKWPTVVLSVKIYCGFFWSAYLHENSRQGNYYTIIDVNQGKHYKINVRHTKFHDQTKQCRHPPL